MSCATTHGAHQAGADALFYARAVLADLPHFDDATVLHACTAVFDHPEASDELRAEAEEIRNTIIGKAG